MADVFISYKRNARERVEKIASLLTASGFSVWFDARLTPGSSDGFDAEINREVAAAATVLVCWTPDAVLSTYVRAEAKIGLERGVLTPVMLEHCKLPIPFNDIDACNLTGWDGDTTHPEWSRVVAQIRRLTSNWEAERAKLDVALQSAAQIADRWINELFEHVLERITSREHVGVDYHHCGKMLEIIKRFTLSDREHGTTDAPESLEEAASGGDPALQALMKLWEVGEHRAYTHEEYNKRAEVRDMALIIAADIADVLKRDTGYRRRKPL